MFEDRHERFERKSLNLTAYQQLFKLKMHFKGVVHLMAQDETDTRLFLDMVRVFSD
jgi:hypothetical protein